jgi:putative peptidoglycan lipid II flippase
VSSEGASDKPPSASRGATWVAAGILCSRLLGFVRERVLGSFFGLGAFADVFTFALRGPNFLQNLLGEGTLSAAFIPVYTRFLKEDRAEEARRFAGAIFGLLCAVAAAIGLVGVVFARPLAKILVSGYLLDAAAVEAGKATIDRFELAVIAIRWMFPMTGFLVLAAWCLGVLNSHRRFFFGYVAPVLWNLAILAAVAFAVVADWSLRGILFAACAGALLGGILQFGAQLPLVVRLLGGLRPSLDRRIAGVGEALRNFTPVVVGRGAVQITSYLDFWFASFLALGAQAALRAANQFYLLPLSLFGMSVAAAELPDLTRLAGSAPEVWRERLDRALRKMSFFNVPATVAFLALGPVIIGGVMQTGAFGVVETRLASLVLAAAALGLLTSTSSRLLINTFYAQGDSRTPSRIALLRVATWLVAAVPLMLLLDRLSPLPAGSAQTTSLRCGAVGLALAGAIGGWVEFGLLIRALRRGPVRGFSPPWGAWARMTVASALAAAAAGALAWAMRDFGPVVRAVAVLPLFGLVYLGMARGLGVSQLGEWFGRRRKREPGGRSSVDSRE